MLMQTYKYFHNMNLFLWKKIEIFEKFHDLQ